MADMNISSFRKAALLAGVSFIGFSGTAQAQMAGSPYELWNTRPAVAVPSPSVDRATQVRRSLVARKKAARIAETKTEKAHGPVPSGQLHVVVSIDRQRATLYADGKPVASTPVSTGTKSHPTPMGFFTVIQKDRHHVSNLYNAPMPFMQRITWSGSALHQGPLPGYPASHGCVRLTTEFATLLWRTTKMGARVIVTKPDVAPVEFQHALLFAPKPKTAKAEPLVRTAQATEAPGAIVQDGSPAPVTTPAATEPAQPEAAASAPPLRPAVVASGEDERWTATESAAGVRDLERRTSPVSVFVSRKDQKLYVRQGMEPVFEVPIKILNPQQPIGTHVYTAMAMKDGGTAMRWTSVTIPSGYAREAAPIKGAKGKHAAEKPAKVEDYQHASSASVALDRLDLPPDAVDKISAMMIPGSSLIVSDNGIGNETGKYTDFIILTR